MEAQSWIKSERSSRYDQLTKVFDAKLMGKLQESGDSKTEIKWAEYWWNGQYNFQDKGDLRKQFRFLRKCAVRTQCNNWRHA